MQRTTAGRNLCRCLFVLFVLVSFKTLLKRPYLSRVAPNPKTNEIMTFYFIFAPQNANMETV